MKQLIHEEYKKDASQNVCKSSEFLSDLLRLQKVRQRFTNEDQSVFTNAFKRQMQNNTNQTSIQQKQKNLNVKLKINNLELLHQPKPRQQLFSKTYKNMSQQLFNKQYQKSDFQQRLVQTQNQPRIERYKGNKMYLIEVSDTDNESDIIENVQ